MRLRVLKASWEETKLTKPARARPAATDHEGAKNLWTGAAVEKTW